MLASIGPSSYLSQEEHSSPSHPAADIASVAGQGRSFPTDEVDSAAIARIGNTIHVSSTHRGSRPNIAAADRPLEVMCWFVMGERWMFSFCKLGFYTCSEAVEPRGNKQTRFHQFFRFCLFFVFRLFLVFVARVFSQVRVYVFFDDDIMFSCLTNQISCTRCTVPAYLCIHNTPPRFRTEYKAKINKSTDRS